MSTNTRTTEWIVDTCTECNHHRKAVDRERGIKICEKCFRIEDLDKETKIEDSANLTLMQRHLLDHLRNAVCAIKVESDANDEFRRTVASLDMFKGPLQTIAVDLHMLLDWRISERR